MNVEEQNNQEFHYRSTLYRGGPCSILQYVTFSWDALPLGKKNGIARK